MRNLAEQRPESPIPGPSANLGDNRPGGQPYAAAVGKKRPREGDDFHDPRGGKVLKMGSDPGAAARLVDTQQNLGGKKRPREGDDIQDPRGGKVPKKGSDSGAAARLFDTQQNLYGMEYMKYGDVR